MSYDLCLFDLDGTLTDPKPGITKSFQYTLSHFGISEELDRLTRFIGPPLREIFSGVYGFSDVKTEKAVAKYRKYFVKTGLYENTVYPSVPEVLRCLEEAGKTLAVATNKVTAYTEKILEHFDLRKYFAFVSGDEMDGSLTKNGKRDIIEAALATLDPERVKSAVMIGDRRHDIIGAREAGIDSIGVTWGYGSRDELEAENATRIADSLDELKAMLI